MTGIAEPAAPARAQASSGYGWYVVGVLIVAYTFSYVDRTILTLLVKPIRASLEISDTQVSLLHGLAFALFYTGFGIPIAWFADRYNRRNIITAGIVAWSGMTAACAFARSFGQLFLARIGVGVGEAALGPAAYSLLGDYFRGPALARAMSAYTSAIYVGAGLALVIGGTVIASVKPLDVPGLGHFEPWQVVFLFVGLPGLAVALLMLTVREPARTGLKAGSRAGEGLPLRDVAAYLRERSAAYGFLIAGFATSSLMWNGANGWIPTYFIRTFGWTPAEVGLRFGFVLLVCGTVGVLLGSAIGARLIARGQTDGNARVGIISALIAGAAGVAAPLIGDPMLSLAAWALFCLGGSMPYGVAGAVLTEITPNQMRAQVTALYFFCINLAGIGTGPTVVALFTDHVFHDDLAVKYSLAVVTAIAAPLSALLLWRALRPYRRCLDAIDF